MRERVHSHLETVGWTQLLTSKLTNGDAMEMIPTITDRLDCLNNTEEGNIYIGRHLKKQFHRFLE